MMKWSWQDPEVFDWVAQVSYGQDSLLLPNWRCQSNEVNTKHWAQHQRHLPVDFQEGALFLLCQLSNTSTNVWHGVHDYQRKMPWYLISVLVLAISSIRFRASNFLSGSSLDSRTFRSRSSSLPCIPVISQKDNAFIDVRLLPSAAESLWAYALFGLPISMPIHYVKTWCHPQNQKHVNILQHSRRGRIHSVIRS